MISTSNKKVGGRERNSLLRMAPRALLKQSSKSFGPTIVGIFILELLSALQALGSGILVKNGPKGPSKAK